MKLKIFQFFLYLRNNYICAKTILFSLDEKIKVEKDLIKKKYIQITILKT